MLLPADVMMECTMDYDSIAKAGSMLGSGAVIVMDDTRCMVDRACFACPTSTMHESCGQCTPCREGTGLDLARAGAHLRWTGRGRKTWTC